MNGLTSFIRELERCKNKQEESKRITKELANIQNKFKGDILLNGYQKKKYICKLVFMYLLGYKCKLGTKEAVNLLSSNAYSEKQAGYLFISVVEGSNCNLMPIVISELKSDLSSSKPIFQNLALQFIASSTDVKLAESLADPIVNFLVSYDTADSLKQSAVLAFLQLLRINPILALEKFNADCLNSLISHPNFGVATASASLMEFLVKRFPSQFESCVPYCIKKLSRIVSCPNIDFRDYSYYCVAAPWITVKLLQILQNFPAPSKVLKVSLEGSLEKILRYSDYELQAKGLYRNKAICAAVREARFRYNNAKYAVIFEAISLIAHMEFGEPLRSRAFTTLGAALQRKNTHLKFMALEMMIRLAKTSMLPEYAKPQFNGILDLLMSESDITIKKQLVDLLYIICSVNNVKPIIDEMFYLLETEHTCSEDIILQISALAEQFGTDRQWYFDTILKLLQICGGKISDSVWYSLVNVVINDNNIQEYAAKTSYAFLCERNCCDTVIKTAGYILGEMGYLIASDPQSSHQLQFRVLKEKYRKCSPTTKALLLTTFMKFLNLYPDLEYDIQLLLKDECNIKNENVEIQQRAVEYLKLSEVTSKSLLSTILKEMPSSKRKVPATVAAIENKKAQDFCSDSASHSNPQPVISSSPNLLVDMCKDSLTFYTSDSLPEVSIPEPLNLYVPNNQFFLHNMFFNETAKLYENNIIEVVIESEFKQCFGKFHLKYINKTSNEFTEFSIEGNFDNFEDKCHIWIKPCDSILLAEGVMEQDIHLECLDVFSERPSLNLKFVSDNKCNEIKLILPLTLNKFVDPYHMSLDAFAKRWQNFESVGQEVVRNFAARYTMVYGNTREKLEAFRLSVIENSDSEYENSCCSGIFCTRKSQIGFLVRLEKHIRDNKYCCRVRSNHLSLSHVISNLLFELL